MKVFFRRIHLYLALVAGVVITTCCLTGAILVFEDELQHTFQSKRYYVKERSGADMSIMRAVNNLKEQVPEAKIGSVKRYANDATRTIEISYKLKTDKERKKKNSPEYNWKAFANPYTGEIVDAYDTKQSFFFKVLSIHRWLLADDTGKLITGISTLIFLFIIITGIILWWPANKNILKSRLKLKTDVGWKRTNHDWHIVLGFYASIILFVFAFTALAWSFKWFNNSIYTVTHSPLKNPEPPKSAVIEGEKKINFDQALAGMSEAYPDKMTWEVISYNVVAPKEDDGVFAVSVLSANAVHVMATDMYYVDAYSGKLLGTLLYKDKSAGAQVRSIFKPLHTGSIWGLPSKIIALLAVLIGASLPVTGYIIWFNRTRKKMKKTFV